MSGILHKNWLAEVVAEWDRVRKLNAFEDSYLAWIFLLQDETLVQETKYLALHFCCFSGIMLHRNLEYLSILQLYFNSIIVVHTGHANFDFNQCSIFTECCV